MLLGSGLPRPDADWPQQASRAAKTTWPTSGPRPAQRQAGPGRQQLGPAGQGLAHRWRGITRHSHGVAGPSRRPRSSAGARLWSKPEAHATLRLPALLKRGPRLAGGGGPGASADPSARSLLLVLSTAGPSHALQVHSGSASTERRNGQLTRQRSMSEEVFRISRVQTVPRSAYWVPRLLGKTLGMHTSGRIVLRQRSH